MIASELTEEQEDFFRKMMHIVVNDHKKGQPFLRQAFFKMKPYNVQGLETMSIDNYYHVYIDFDYMMELGVEEGAKFLNHEVWHPLRDHRTRSTNLPSLPQGYDSHFAGNIAGDLEINDDIVPLVPPSSIFPQAGLFTSYPEGLTLEQYYEVIAGDLPRLVQYYPELLLDTHSNGMTEPPPPGDESESSEGSDPDSSQPDSQSSDSDPASERASDSESEAGGDSSEDESSDSSEAENSGSGELQGASSKPDETEQDSEDSDSGDSSPIAGPGKQGGTSSGGDGQDPEQGGKPGQAQGGSSSEGDGQSEGQGGEPGQHPPSASFHTCGSSAGSPEDYEIPPTDQELIEKELGIVEAQVAQDISDYIKEHGSIGSGRSSSSVVDWAKSQQKTKYIPWEQQFRGHFRVSYAKTSGNTYRSYSRFARRQPLAEVLFPHTYAPKPTVGIALDVSGSNIGNLPTLVKVISEILKRTGVMPQDVKAFVVDTDVSETMIVQDPMDLITKFAVGGGTRMAPGYKKLAELAQDISILVTDGGVYDYPKEAPKNKFHKRTKFITLIIVNDEDKYELKDVERAKKYLDSWGVVIPVHASTLKKKSL